MSKTPQPTFPDLSIPSLLHVPAIVSASHVCRQSLNIATLRRLDFSIPQKRESVLVSVPYVVILESGVLNGLEEVNSLGDRRPSVKIAKYNNADESTYRALATNRYVLPSCRP
jgi:hypothetical protein